MSVSSEPQNNDVTNAIPQPRRFRLASRDVLLTYPQCDASKEELEQHLRRVFKDFAKAAICLEHHSDGSPHLHAIVHLTKRCDLHSSRTLDFRDGRGRIFHGNYQPARSTARSLDYVEKNGNVLYCGGTMDDVRGVFQNRLAPQESGKKRINECFERLCSGKTVASVLMDDDLQACMIMHRKNLETAVAAINAEKALKKQYNFVTASGNPGSPSSTIAEWLNQNLMKIRTFGALQLYLHGPTGIGKTHLISTLEPALRIYYLNMTEDWMDGYDDENVDVIVIEEFNSQKTIQFMNQLLDGQPMPLRIRNGCNGKLKKKNVPIIILSNYGLHEVYSKVDAARKATFERRVLAVYSAERLDVRIDLQPAAPESQLRPDSPEDHLISDELLEPSLSALYPPSPQPPGEPQPPTGTGNISQSLVVAEDPFIAPERIANPFLPKRSRWQSRPIDIRDSDEE